DHLEHLHGQDARRPRRRRWTLDSLTDGEWGDFRTVNDREASAEQVIPGGLLSSVKSSRLSTPKAMAAMSSATSRTTLRINGNRMGIIRAPFWVGQSRMLT